MDDIIQAIASNDLVKFKRCFNEAMATKVGKVLQEEKLQIAKSVMIEGEEAALDDEDDEDEGDDNPEPDEDD
ncbi:prohead core protein [Acinetobacter phage vB_AbaM_PhT2]|uniref:Prohead core protein n=2 Tax=Hadassahvirus TaxID=2842716 RepID=A0A6B9SZ85_9CAUD|nr:prohead [Acinetobacter phage AbTZA1]YP_009887173.1 prohead [Acinetobacter phage vB_AbaM_PhT2]QQO96376.1 prohead core protein [Acinetobacter phage Minot]QQO96625.1 prohead core protein [Acinetobacter phage Mokit]QQO96880.1 prohead core protein [Acinetobacter phage Melin]UQS94254.1 prohead core protein [Acinetobacter phage AB-Navy71]AZU98748.1 prohead assembly (scaffolding) protein [Acinetobacter phage AbTZA1]